MLASSNHRGQRHPGTRAHRRARGGICTSGFKTCIKRRQLCAALCSPGKTRSKPRLLYEVALFTIDYTFGHDEIAQRVVEKDDQQTVTKDETHIFGHDGHGSVRVLYDLAGTAANLAQAFTFAAYGEMLAVHGATAAIDPAGPATELGYSGEHFDAKAQQQYLRARFYNPANGRFNRLDPFAGNMQDPQSPHKYSYVHGDPIGGIDPSGEFLTGSLGGIGARLYMGAKIASVALNTYGFVSNTVDAAQYARSGQFLRATYHAMWATIDGIALGTELVGFFKPPTPPPSLAFSVVAASGNALSVSLRWQQLIAVSRPLAIWALDHLLPAITRSSAGLLGSYVAMMQGFQPLDTSSTSNVRDNYTGEASGGDNLPVVTNGDDWLSGGIGFFPKQVADKLRGRVFTSFKDFREAFWTAVSEVPVLKNSFSPSNQALISKGKSPFAPPAEQLGGRKVFELDHIETLKIGRGGTVYNMDEIMVAGPRVHDELTYPLRQAGSTAR